MGTGESWKGGSMSDRQPSATPHRIADKATDMEKSYAFEWLRGIALGTKAAVNDANSKRLAAIALDEWHACKERADSVPSEIAPTAKHAVTQEMYAAGMKYLHGRGTAWCCTDLYLAMEDARVSGK